MNRASQLTGPSLPQSEDRDSAFQLSITKTMAEFAGALPDYHKPDIMNLINSYMPLEPAQRPSVRERAARESARYRFLRTIKYSGTSIRWSLQADIFGCNIESDHIIEVHFTLLICTLGS